MIDSDVVTLRIKRVYLDQIAGGKKWIEYRSRTSFYDKLFDFGRRRFRFLVLHYQSSAKLLCEVERVEIVPTPHEDRDFFPTSEVYAIHLKGCGRYTSKRAKGARA